MGNDLQTVLLQYSAFPCIFRFFGLSSFDTVTTLMLSHLASFLPFFEVIPAFFCNFVEAEFLTTSNFFVCDDLGREWADHIGVTEEKVMFYLSKYKDSTFSATSFQDIVGQAQKNLGNLTAQDYQLASKRDFWNGIYPNSEIKRLRKGDDVDDFINQFKAAIKNPYLKREMYLVINFISKSELQENLNKLKSGITFGQKNETIQILWFISSLVSSCKEVNVDPYICCKP